MQHHHLAHDVHPRSRRLLKSQDCKLSGFGACNPHLSHSASTASAAADKKLKGLPAADDSVNNKNTPNGDAGRLVIREFDYEDRYFSVCTADNSLFGYGIFDGQTGGYAAKFFSEELVSELLDQAALFKLQAQLVKRFLLRIFRESDDAYARLTSMQQAVQDREELRQLFLRSPSPLLTPTPQTPSASRSPTPNAQKQQIKFDLLEFYHALPEQARKYEHAEALLRDGASCVVCILAHGKLYTATCGTARAVLCRVKPGKGLDVVQLSPDHRLSNDDERLRVYETGALVSMPSGSNDSNYRPTKADETLSLLLDPTRMLGNIALKVFFNEYPGLEQCSQTPLSAEPEIGLHSLTPSSSDPKKSFDAGFLLLFTDRLEKAVRHSGLLQISLDPDDDRKAAESINELLCYMVSEEMNQHATLDRVARAVVGRVAHALRQRRLNLENSGAVQATDLPAATTDDDTSISLLIRNLRHPLPLATANLTQQELLLHANDGLPSSASAQGGKISPRHRTSAVKTSNSFTAIKKPTVYDNVVTQSDQYMQHAVSMSDISDAVMEEAVDEQPSTPTPTGEQHGDSILTSDDDEAADRTPWSLFSSAEDVSMRSLSDNSSRPASASDAAATVQQPQPKRIAPYTNFNGYFAKLRSSGVAEEPDLTSFLR